MSDETIALRHERSEREENKRFMTYINMPHQTRIRPSQRRVDSRADSGANTPGTTTRNSISRLSLLVHLADRKQSNILPDPMSPHASDLSGDVISPITSPPATPSHVQDTEHPQPSSLDSQRPSALQNALRRRAMPVASTATLRLGRDDTAVAFTEDENEVKTRARTHDESIKTR